MLSESEQRALAGIEDQLSLEDPTWVDGFAATQHRLAVAARTARREALLVIAAAVTTTLAVIMLAAGVLSLAGLFLLWTAWLISILERPSCPSRRRAPRPRDDKAW